MKIKFFRVLLHSALVCGIVSASSDVSRSSTSVLNVLRSEYLSASVDDDERPYLYQDVEYITPDSVDVKNIIPPDNFGVVAQLTDKVHYMIGEVGSEAISNWTSLVISTGRQIIVNGTLEVSNELTIKDDLVISGPGHIIADTLYISDDVTIHGLSSITANYLYITAGTRISSSTSIDVIEEVSASDSSMVDLPENLGNKSTYVDLAFSRGSFQLFTPPFDIFTDNLGIVENNLSAAGTSESVWLFSYNEANEAADGTENSWELMDSGEKLIAGKGYSIWVAADGSAEKTIRLSSESSYPNLTDLISPNISYTDLGNLNLTSGMNALGNPYSLPLLLPANDNVKAYYYHDGENYKTMAGDIIVGDPTLSTFEIPTYSTFFASVKSKNGISFTLTDLDVNSSEERSVSAFLASPEYIRIALQNESSYDDMVLRFVEGASSDADVYDITKLFDPNSLADIEMSSALASGVGYYAIQSFPVIEELGYGELLNVPLRFNVNGVNEYNISSTLTNISSNEIEIFLYDDLTEQLISLDDNSQSITLASTYDKTGRYHIKAFLGIPASVDDDLMHNNSVNMYVHDNTMYIQPEHDSISGQFEVLDMYGKVLLTDNFTGDSFFSLSDLPRGIYHIRVDSDNLFSFSTKVFID